MDRRGNRSKASFLAHRGTSHFSHVTAPFCFCSLSTGCARARFGAFGSTTSIGNEIASRSAIEERATRVAALGATHRERDCSLPTPRKAEVRRSLCLCNLARPFPPPFGPRALPLGEPPPSADGGTGEGPWTSCASARLRPSIGHTGVFCLSYAAIPVPIPQSLWAKRTVADNTVSDDLTAQRQTSAPRLHKIGPEVHRPRRHSEARRTEVLTVELIFRL